MNQAYVLPMQMRVPVCHGEKDGDLVKLSFFFLPWLVNEWVVQGSALLGHELICEAHVFAQAAARCSNRSLMPPFEPGRWISKGPLLLGFSHTSNIFCRTFIFSDSSDFFCGKQPTVGDASSVPCHPKSEPELPGGRNCPAI